MLSFAKKTTFKSKLMKFFKIVILAISVLVVLVIARSCFSSFSRSLRVSDEVSNVDTAIILPRVEPKSWDYSYGDDKMTSKKSYYAEVEANELLEFDFPYNGGSTATLTIRNKSGKNEAYLSVSKGQMLTRSYKETSYRVRFDDRPAQVYPFIGPSDNSSDLAFINNANKFIKNLKKSKKVIVELEFYQEGLRAIEFNVSNLKWDH